MKILIAADTYYPIVNGASYAAQRLADWLQRDGYEVLVVAPSRSFMHEAYSHEKISIRGVSSFPIERIQVAIPLIATNQIKKAIVDFRPDVVHIQMHFLVARQAVYAAKSMGIPVVGTNHFMPENLIHYLPIPKSMYGVVKKMAWQDFVKLFNTLDVVISPTIAGAKVLKDAGLTKEVKVISNGIDTERFSSSKSGLYLKKRYHMPDCPLLLFVGRVDKEKNLDVVIAGFAKFVKRARAHSAHFVIAGLGAEKKKLERLVFQLGIANDVTFTGFVPDVDLPNLYAQASCFIIGGTAELQSIAAMEAMASGLPVIAANAVALPELVEHGQNGFLFAPGDIDVIAQNLEAIFSNVALQKSMAKKSLDIIRGHDIQKVIKQYGPLYKSVL